MRRVPAVLILPAILGACAEPVWAPDDIVSRAAYRFGEPASLTLVTVVSTRDGSGAHSALLVNASQRVIFDPAGTFKADTLPERNDVIYGITPRAFDIYVDYHARTTYDVILQEIDVSPIVAERALQIVEANGAVPKAMCASSVAGVLRQLPGFEDAPGTFFPRQLMNYMAQKPGVSQVVVHDDDSDNNKAVLAAADARLAADQ